MKIILVSIKTRRNNLIESIKDMKRLNFNIEVIRHYEQQLSVVVNTIKQQEEHDDKQKLLFAQQEIKFTTLKG
ncbi:MAG: hypothetical protein IIC74_04430 [Bacteroidetes bacterium]|nr:hypothetical protein [Bacteroidota bacterium]